MTQQPMPFERAIAGWMADEAAGAPDPLLEQILQTTARTAPRPRLVAVIAEPTLRGRTGRVAVGLPNRGLVLAAIAGLLLAAFAAAAIGAWLLLNQKPTETADWPGFLGTTDHRALAVDGPKGHPVVTWQFHAAGGVLEVALIGDRAYFASDDGRLHAISRDRGIEQWSVPAAAPPLSGPFAADGRLYLSDASGAFRAFAQADGATLWTSPTAYTAPTRAIAVNGTLYFGTADGLLVALDAATGRERWRLQPPGATVLGTPAYSDGRIYAGTGAGFVAVDAATQQVVWSANTGGEQTGSATVADGIAYLGAAAETTADGSLHAFDATTGRPLWTADRPRHGVPTVVDGVAYSSSNAGELAAFDTATGATRWAVQIGGDVKAPVVAGGVVFVSAADAHRLLAFDAATGDELWQLDLDGPANCCIAVARGAIVVGTLSGSVYSIGGDGAALTGRPATTPSVTPSPSPTPSVSIGPSPSPLPSVGTVTWTADLRRMGFAPVSQIAIHPKTGQIWAPESNAGRIAIYDPTGELIEEWGEPGDGTGQFDFTRGNGDGYGTLAFAKDGSFYVLDVGNRRVQQFDANRHFVRAWGAFGTRPKEYSDPVGIAVAPDDTLWVLDDIRSVVEHYTADGKVLGSFDPFAAVPINKGANSLAVDRHGNLYVSGAAPNKVFVFDPTGRPLRSVGDGEFSEQAGDMAVDAAGRLFVTQGPERGGRPGVLVFDADGTLIGGFGPEGPGDGQLIFPGGIALDGKGSLYIEDSWFDTARLMKVQLPATFAP